jgi:hypothetical protein
VLIYLVYPNPPGPVTYNPGADIPFSHNGAGTSGTTKIMRSNSTSFTLSKIGLYAI